MTIYWILWVIGWIFVVATLKFIPWWDGRDALAGKPLKTRITIIVLICISIMMVGGIINGIFLGPLLGSNSELKSMNLQEIINLAANTVAIPAFLTYAVGFAVLGLQRIKNVFLHIIFLMIFVVSIAFWTIPITKYNQNIVVEKSTSIANTVEHDLYYFCNIPVQKISGHISGSSIVGSGSVSGNIYTSDTLPYWYDDGNGDALYDSVNAYESKIDFIEDGETPFVRIVTYYAQEVKVNYNTGERTILSQDWWDFYEFHVPIEIMEYNIN